MSNLPLIEFNPKLPKLSKNERQVLDLLVEAGKLIAPLYLEQENQAGKVSRTEMEKAAKKDPAVRSPYTVVEKVAGKIVVTPYHVKYAKFLKPIADKLEEAAKITENKEFGRFLRLQAKALMDGTYDEATIAWLKTKRYILDISIGPINHFDDQLFSAKAAYQCWVGVINSEETKEFEYYKEITLSTRRKILIPGARIDNQNQIRVKMDHVILFSGLMARTQFVGVNLPMNLKIVEAYGSESTFFKEVNDLRLIEQIIPTFNKVFSREFSRGFSSEDLRRGSINYVVLHEIAHNYLYYKNAFKNLQDLLPCIYELSATVLGIRLAGSLLLKDIISTKQLESMIITFICRSFYLIKKSKVDKYIINYARGGAIFINFMLESGALKQLRGLAIPNFMKIFVSLHDLSYMLENLLSSGSRKDAEAFIKKYGQLSNADY